MTAHYERWPAPSSVLDHDWRSIISANGLSSLVADADDDPVLVFDALGGVVFANRAARELFEFSVDEAATESTSIASFAIHEHHQRLRAAMEDVLAGESVRVVFTAQLPAAGMRSLVGSIVPLRDGPSSRALGGLMLLRAPRVAVAGGSTGAGVDDRLIRLAGRLARFDGWSLTLADESVRWRNDGVTRLHELWSEGCTVDEIVATMSRDDAVDWQRALIRAIADQGVFDVTAHHRDAAGGVVVVRWTGKVELDPQTGSPIRVTGIAQDITEIMAAKDRQDAVERQLAETLEALSDGVMRFNHNRRLVYLNAVASTLIDRTRDSLLGHTPEHIFRDFPEVLAIVALAETSSGDNSHREVIASHNEAVWQVTAYRVDGTVTLLLRDVTEQQRTTQAAEHAERELTKARRWEALGTLAGGLAHDLNNALTPIAISAQLLTRTALSAQQVAAVSIIEKSSTRAKDMITQVLSFANLGRTPRGPVDIADLASELDGYCRGVMPAEVDFRLSVEHELPIVEADVTELYQVLTNLAVNARDAVVASTNAAPKVVEMRFSSGAPLAHATPWPRAVPDRVVRIEVIDTGTGMSEEVLEQIFEPFFTTKGPGRGTGLGLPSVLRIIRASGGRLIVASAEGVGTTFTVEIPALQQETSAQRDSMRNAPDRADGAGKHILVLDDEFAVRWAVESLLHEAGYTVSAVDSVESATATFDNAGRIDAVITDIDLANGSGLDLVRRAARTVSPCVVIAMTGSGAAQPVPASLESLVSDVLRKPFHPDALLAALDRAFTLRNEATP